MNRKLLFLPLIAMTLGLAGCGADRNVISTNVNDPNKKVESITLVADYQTLKVDEFAIITPYITYKNNEEVAVDTAWTSSRPLVASVTEVNGVGHVHAKAVGSTNITFMAGYKSASLLITVKQEDTPQPVVTITLSTYSETLNVGGSFNLIANASDGSPVTFSSENDAVATVSAAGLVNAVAVGSTNIVASAGAVTAKCAVTVQEEGAFTLTVSPRNKTLKVGESFTVAANPSDPSATISWESSDPSVASVNSSGLVRALAVGSTNIVASANGVSATCAVTVEEAGGGDDDEDKNVEVYFFLDYNNFAPDDEIGDRLLAKFYWYVDRPFTTDVIPQEPTSAKAPTSDKTNFIGWSHHSLVDEKEDLWNVATDTILARLGNRAGGIAFFFGIWSDVTKEAF